MNRTKTIYFLSAIVCIIGCYALSLSYSLFVDTQEREIVNATVPGLSYSLETSTFDIEANSSQLIKLKVINLGSADLKYGISVTDTKNVTIQLVEKEGNDIVGELTASTIEGETSSKEVWVYVTNSTETDITGLTFNLTAKYSTLNFDADTFKTSSNIDCVNTVKLLNNAILARAKSTEITDEEKTVYSTTLSTTPAEEPSGENERLLLETEDDYTATTGKNSYYFRGNVKDNYVNFADMCWRIVRIEGDGSVKLILEDQDQFCNSKDTNGVLNMDGNWDIPTQTNGTTTIGNFGYVSLDNKYNKINYLNTDELATNYNNSMATAFKNFQSTFTNKELDELKSGNWCMNDTAYSSINTISTPLTEEEKQSKYNSYNSFYYDSFVRLYGVTTKQPTLKCNGTVMDKFGDNTTNMYVGGITADELVYAGGNIYSSNYTYYLINDYQVEKGLLWWSFSPCGFDRTSESTFIVNDDGSMADSIVDLANSLRPSVSLASSAVITDGIGTQEEPYVIG